MRSLVPSFLLLSAVLCLTAPAHASSLSDVLKSIGCNPAPSDENIKARCAEAKLTYCRLSDDKSDCGDVPDLSANTPIEGPGERGSINESNVAALVAKYCKAPHDLASKCCSANADACQDQIKSKQATQAIKDLLAAQADTEGLKNDCDKSAKINGDGAKATYGVAGVCDSAQSVCSQECDEIVRELDRKIASEMAAKENPDWAIEQQNLAKSYLQACKSKSSTALVTAAEQYSGGQTMSVICGDAAKDQVAGSGSEDPGAPSAGGQPSDGEIVSADPQSTGSGLGSMMPMLAQMLPSLMQAFQKPPVQPLDRVDCSVNPNLAGCPMPGQATSDSWNQKNGMAEASVNPAEGGTFNLPEGGDGFTPQGGVPTGPSSNPPTVASVPNGGGGIPGGGGGGPANLGGGGGGGGGGAQLGSKADVLHGVGSAAGGGYSQTNAGLNVKSGESGGYNYGGGVGSDSGLNLGDFLPGGKQDPSRRTLAGQAAAGNSNFQIQAKDVNIWNRISERIKSRCSQGLLRDCIP